MHKLLRSFLLAFFLFFVACSGPQLSRGRPPTCSSGQFRVAFHGFSPKYENIARQSIASFHALGLYPVIVPEHSPHTVTVNRWDHNCTRDPRIGYATHGANFVMVDALCVSSRQQFGAIVIHELGHWVGMDHVCDETGLTTDHCSPVGRGRGVMNPYLSPTHTWVFSDLDVAEFRRTCPLH